VWHGLYFGLNSSLSAVPGSAIHMTGATFENESTTPDKLSGLSNLSLIFEGGDGVIDSFEVASAIGGGFSENFALGSLVLGGSDVGFVRLVDHYDNGNRGLGGRESLFVHELVISPDSSLDLNGLPLYVAGDMESVLDSWIADDRLFDGDGVFLDAVYDVGHDWTFVLDLAMLGDTNNDHIVDVFDLDNLIAQFGGEPDAESADFNYDGIVDLRDFVIIRENFGFGVGLAPEAEFLATTPEPATLSLLALGGIVLVRRRKRGLCVTATEKG
jgi:hypothetical protein